MCHGNGIAWPRRCFSSPRARADLHRLGLSIFECLAYVKRVALSTTLRGLEHNAAVVLQIKPPPRQSPTASLFPDLAR